MKEPIINDNNTLQLFTLKYDGKEWMEVDDLINWLKLLKKNSHKAYHPFIHYQIKSIIKMRNSPKT
jgi:hypothetical protein